MGSWWVGRLTRRKEQYFRAKGLFICQILLTSAITIKYGLTLFSMGRTRGKEPSATSQTKVPERAGPGPPAPRGKVRYCAAPRRAAGTSRVPPYGPPCSCAHLRTDTHTSHTALRAPTPVYACIRTPLCTYTYLCAPPHSPLGTYSRTYVYTSLHSSVQLHLSIYLCTPTPPRVPMDTPAHTPLHSYTFLQTPPCTPTPVHLHIYLHVHSAAYTHTCIYTSVYANIHLRTNAYLYNHLHARIYIYTHTYAHSSAHPCLHIHTAVHPYISTQTPIYTHPCSYTRRSIHSTRTKAPYNPPSIRSRNISCQKARQDLPAHPLALHRTTHCPNPT